jgi:hypothetical protein
VVITKTTGARGPGKYQISHPPGRHTFLKKENKRMVKLTYIYRDGEVVTRQIDSNQITSTNSPRCQLGVPLGASNVNGRDSYFEDFIAIPYGGKIEIEAV